MALVDEWNEEIHASESKLQGLHLKDDVSPIFTIEPRADLLSQGRGYAVAFAVSNDNIFVATSRCFVLRHDVTGAVVELELSKSPDAQVRRMFVDPLGTHVLITLQTGSVLELLHLDASWKKARPLAKLKGMIITSVGWPPVSTVTSLGDVLLGTEKGALFGLDVDAMHREKATHLGTLPGRSTAPGTDPVAGLAQLSLKSSSPPATSSASRVSDQRLVIVLCGTKVHFFRGEGPLVALFSTYDPSSLLYKEPKVFDLPIEQGAAQLQVLCPPSNPSAAVMAGTAPFQLPSPSDFAILSTSGVYYGRLNLDDSLSDELDHLVGHKLLPASALLHHRAGKSTVPAPLADRPLSLALTQHHLVLLYPSRLQFVNRVSKHVVQEVPLERFAAPLRGVTALPLGLCRDAVAGRVVVLAGDDALDVDAAEEDRNMWRVFLERGDYKAALPFCRSAAQRNEVYLAEADAALAQGCAVVAAELYGRITSATPPFEGVALRLMDTGDPAALRAFLTARLGTLDHQHRAQATMVATWLLELLLDAANRAALGRAEGPESAALADAADADVKKFLTERVGALDPGTTKALLEGYNRSQDMLTFASARGDAEGILECLVGMSQAERALEVLRRPSVSVELAYRFAPALVSLAPAQTVASWINSNPPLEPRRLLPALLHLGEPRVAPAARAEALRYVRYCTDQLGCTDAALHNFAVALLAVSPVDESALLDHLRTARDTLGRPLYDPVAALRLVDWKQQPRASVALLTEVGLWEDAVALALKEVGVWEAEAVASRPVNDPTLSKKLWLAIVKHVLAGTTKATANGGAAAVEETEWRKEQVREVSRVMDAASGVLRIEDVLPLFPDFVEIGAFRDAICSSLEQYNEEMERLRGEMAMTSRTVAALRDGLDALEGRTAAVDVESPCVACGRPLLQEPPATAGPSGGALQKVFVFPTGNAFHGSCLCFEVIQVAPAPQKERIRHLVRRLTAVPVTASVVPAEGTEGPVAVEDLRRQLEDEVAVEDPYCGETVVRHLTRPLLSEEEEAGMASWAL